MFSLPFMLLLLASSFGQATQLEPLPKVAAPKNVSTKTPDSSSQEKLKVRSTLEGLVQEMTTGFDEAKPHCPLIEKFLLHTSQRPGYIRNHVQSGYIRDAIFRARRKLVNSFTQNGESCSNQWKNFYKSLHKLEDLLMLYSPKLQQVGIPTIMKRKSEIWNNKIFSSPGMKTPSPFSLQSGDVVLIRRLLQGGELLRLFVEPDPLYNSSGIIHRADDGKVYFLTVDRIRGTIKEDFFNYISQVQNLPYQLTFLIPIDVELGKKASAFAFNLATAPLRPGFDHNYELSENGNYYPAKLIYASYASVNADAFKREDHATELVAKPGTAGEALLRGEKKKVLLESKLIELRQFELAAEWNISRVARVVQLGSIMRGLLTKPVESVLSYSNLNLPELRELWPKRSDEKIKAKIKAMGINVEELNSIQNADAVALNHSLVAITKDCQSKVSVEDSKTYESKKYLPISDIEKRFLACLKL
jgi:hypothetical protein